MSAAAYVETSLIIETRFGAQGLQDLDLLIAKARVEIAPVDAEQASIARRGFSRFGKGRHAAGLNFGDCLSSALAVARHEPLLFKGNDFVHTDVDAAI